MPTIGEIVRETSGPFAGRTARLIHSMYSMDVYSVDGKQAWVVFPDGAVINAVTRLIKRGPNITPADIALRGIIEDAYATGPIWEFVGGVINKDKHETPRQAAIRKAGEESGDVVRRGRLQSKGRLPADTGRINNLPYLFITRLATPGKPDPELSKSIKLEERTLEDAIRGTIRGEIYTATVVTQILLATESFKSTYGFDLSAYEVSVSPLTEEHDRHMSNPGRMQEPSFGRVDGIERRGEVLVYRRTSKYEDDGLQLVHDLVRYKGKEGQQFFIHVKKQDVRILPFIMRNGERQFILNGNKPGFAYNEFFTEAAGGLVEDISTPIQTAMAAAKDELGVDVDPTQIYPVGTVGQVTSRNDGLTHIFMTPAIKVDTSNPNIEILPYDAIVKRIRDKGNIPGSTAAGVLLSRYLIPNSFEATPLSF